MNKLDKYEYQICADQIKTYIAEKKFVEAMKIADTINWRRVKSVSMLCTVSEIYKINKKYEEARDILLLAYDSYPTGRNIVYALCELSIKMKDIVQAIEYYKEYTRIAPEDTGSYILLYKIYEAQDVTLEERIEVLEEFKKRDYREKWAYELATLYHKVGQESKCVATCDELIIWFGEGKYVQKAMELKMQHANLTGDQQRKYDSAYGQNNSYNQNYSGASQYGSEMNYGQDNMGNGYGYPQNGQNMYADQGMYVQPANSNQPKYNTMNLQEELVKSMNQYMPQDNSNIPYYGYDQQIGQSIYEMPAMGQPASQNVYGQPSYEQPVEIKPGYEPIYGPEQYAQDVNMAQELDKKPEISYTSDIALNIGAQQPEETLKPDEAPQENVSAIDNIPQEEVSSEEVSSEEISSKEIASEEVQPSYSEVSYGNYSDGISDPDMVEKQITGQLNLEDILKELEEKKKETSQEESKENENADASEPAADIMSKLSGVIPGGVLPSGRMMTLDEEYGGKIDKVREADRIEQEEKAAAKEEEAEDKVILETAKKTEAHEVEDYGEVEEIPEIEEPEITIPEEEPEEEPVEKELSAEEITVSDKVIESEADKDSDDIDIPEIKFDFGDDEATDGEASEEKTEAVETEVSEEISEEAPEEISREETPEEEIPEIDASEIDASESEASETEETADNEAEVEDERTVSAEPEMIVPKMHSSEPVSNEPVKEETVEASEEEAVTEYVPRKYNNHPSYMTRNEEVRAKRELNENEEQIFIRYAGIEALKAQLVEAMDTISLEASHGNLVITCPDICDRKGITIDVVKAIQAKESAFSGKVAKISGEALNKKNIPVTLSKLQNGALIVENAGGLTRDSLSILTNALTGDCAPVIVILEGTRESMDSLLGGTSLLSKVFNARISITRFTTDDLVAYGKGYAGEQEYSFDEMGVLALYNRIEDMQAFDHSVSVEEVKDIIDAAIKHVDRKNMTHFMDALLGKRYDDDDFIILREKDFIA